jgi:hypothetical protein
VQVVGYDTDDGGLLVSHGGDHGREGAEAEAEAGAGGGGVEYVPLDPGRELSYRLGERHCAGTLHDGAHVACDAADAPYCPDHASTWVCARCTGTCLKDEMDCFDSHAVYLAAFAPAEFKVGVTRAWRLETRLREQGADRGAHVHTVSNGRIARELEAEMAASTPGLTDLVRVDAKRAGLGAAVDEAAWRDLLSGFDVHDEFAFDHGLDLDDRPVAETVVAGTVVGTKGRVLVLERGGTTYAVDMRDLVGYELDEGRDERELQSSLGAFG